jgi:integrase
MSRFKSFNLSSALAAVPERTVLPLTFAEMVRAYDAVHATQDLLLRLKKWVQAFGDRSAWAIHRDELARAAEAMRAHGYAASTANRDLSAIGQVYRWAVHTRKIAPADFRSPTLDIPRAEEALRRVYAGPEQIQRLRAAALAFKDRRFGLFVHLLLDTGARKGELLGRTWDQLDTERRQIRLDNTKTGKPRVLHFTESTARMIERLRPPKGDRHRFIFEGRRGGRVGSPISYRRSWGELVRSIGMPDLRPHDTRHLVAANLLAAGNTVAVAAQVLGHSSLILQRRYGHLEVEPLRRAQEAAWSREEEVLVLEVGGAG